MSSAAGEIGLEVARGPDAPVMECPRCGYDQAGIVAAWSEWCPLDGTCSECGLAFEWRDVLGSRFFGPNWSFEHGAGRVWRRLCATLWRTFVPRVMWRRLALVHRVLVGRLARFAALVLLLGLHVPAVAAVLWLERPDPWYDAGFGSRTVLALLWPYGEELDVRGNHFESFMTPPLVLVFLPTVFMPLSLLLFGQTFRRGRVRRVHIARGVAYSIPGAVAATWVLVGTLYWYFLRAAFGAGGPDPGLIMMGVLAGLLVWLGVWWWSFIGRYLRLRHAVWMAMSMVAVSALGTVVVVLLIGLYLQPPW